MLLLHRFVAVSIFLVLMTAIFWIAKASVHAFGALVAFPFLAVILAVAWIMDRPKDYLPIGKEATQAPESWPQPQSAPSRSSGDRAEPVLFGE